MTRRLFQIGSGLLSLSLDPAKRIPESIAGQEVVWILGNGCQQRAGGIGTAAAESAAGRQPLVQGDVGAGNVQVPLTRRLLESDSAFTLSVSATTRPARDGEREGTDYFFVSPERFDTMIEQHELLEHPRVFGHSYGTPRSPVKDAILAGKDVLFDIDWQGAQQLQDKMSADVVSIFILPPSIPELRRRLVSRTARTS